MDDMDVSESFVQEEDKNEFLDGQFKYENCPHCQRNFFFGKLKYHLKLCKPNNPMTKSPLKKTKRSYISTALQKNQSQIDQLQIQSPTSSQLPEKYKKCQYCRSTFPIAVLQRHTDKCNLKRSAQSNPQDLHKLKSKTKIDFGIKKDLKEPCSALPRIRNSAKQNKNVERKFISQDVKDLKAEYTVRIREDLSCFKKALEVQQIQCQYCHRKFSKQASLRHIPICQKIKLQQMHQVALKKHSKSEIYKLSVPVKKSTLFRSKFLGNIGQKNDDLQIKSARVHEFEKVERQKINNSSLMVKKEDKKSRRLSDLKPLITKEPQQLLNENIPQKSVISNALKQTPSLQMNMTFSKSLYDSSRKNSVTVDISPKKNTPERLPTFQKQEGINLFRQNSSTNFKENYFKNEITQEVQNQFMQVTVSKTKLFAEVVLDHKSNLFQPKQPQSNIQYPKEQQNIKLEIHLQNFTKKNLSHQSFQADQYKMDFDEV